MIESSPAPPTDQERTVLEVYRTVLALPHLKVTDNIFGQGVHSILLLQVQTRLAALGWTLPLATLFRRPTVRTLANALPPPTVVPDRLTIGRAGSPARDALSSAEERMYFLGRLSGGALAYNVPTAIELQGSLDVAALAWGLGEVTRRHDVLRTRLILQDGTPHRVVDDWRPFQLAMEAAEGDAASIAARAVAEEGRLPFDHQRQHPIRARLLRLGRERHVLLLTMHHIATDGWSLRILVRELTQSYNRRLAGETTSAPALTIQYGDYAAWERGLIRQGRHETDVAYWKSTLAGAQSLPWPHEDRKGPPPEHRGAVQSFALPAPLVATLREFCRRREVTVFVVLVAAWKALLRALCGQNDLVVGTPVTCRPSAETEDMIGLFVNTVALRTDTGSAPTFEALVERVRLTCLEAFSHQETPFDLVVRALSGSGGQPGAGTAVVQTMLAYHEHSFFPPLELQGLTVERIIREAPQPKFALSLSVANEGDELHGELEYDAGLFAAATAGRWALHYQRLLESALADPRQPLSDLLGLLGEAAPQRSAPDPAANRAPERRSSPAALQVEATVLPIYRELLEAAELSVTDNIFVHGAHSMLILQLQERLQGALGAEVPLEELFARPTVQELCDFLMVDPTTVTR